MPNTEDNHHHQSAIRQVICDRHWYSYDLTGRFTLATSEEDVTMRLREVIDSPLVTAELVDTAFRQAVANPEYLARTEDGTPFIAKLADFCAASQAQLFGWTEGDPAWQRYKRNSIGVTDYLPDERFLCATTSKIAELPARLKYLAKIAGGKRLHVLIIDDKDPNIKAVTQLAQTSMEKYNIVLHTYHLKLDDPQADPEQCIQHLQGQFAAEVGDSPVIVLCDYDGVMANTNEAITTGSSQIIAARLNLESNPEKIW